MAEGLFSASQVEYLSAMGYAVLALQAADVSEALTAPTPARVSEALTAPTPANMSKEGVTNASLRNKVMQPETMVTPPPASKAPDFIPATPPADVTTARAAAVRATAPSTPLERALLAATGQTRRVDARAVLEELQVDIEALRDDPAAKRALWPRLRAIRSRRR